MPNNSGALWEKWCKIRFWSSVSPFSKMSNQEKASEFVGYAQEQTGNPVGIMKAKELGAPDYILDELMPKKGDDAE